MGKPEKEQEGYGSVASCADWSFWQAWLRNETIDGRQRVLALLRSGFAPDDLLHHFACDCLERTLSLCRKRGWGAAEELTTFVAIKRKWVEGQAGWEEVQKAREGVRRLHEAEQASSLRQVEWMVLWSSCEEAEIAARYASYYPLFAEDRRWQCSRLEALLAGLFEHRKKLLGLLCFRKKALEGHDRWRESLEAPLFEGS